MVVSPMDFDITLGMMIKAAGVAAVLFPCLILIEILARASPTFLSLDTEAEQQPTGTNMTPCNSNSNSNEVTIIEMEEQVADLGITTKHRCYFLPILAAFGHFLLISSCVLAVLWSVSSIHGLCWTAFWEWVATSITAVLIQAVILDTIKAVILTVVKVHGDKKSGTSKPHALIY